jgi:hypothetical protein
MIRRKWRISLGECSDDCENGVNTSFSSREKDI